MAAGLAIQDWIEYPFPLEAGLAYLRLSRSGLSVEDAERLKAYIDTLVTEPHRGSGAG